MKRLVVDIGGNFTACFISREDRLLQTKALTSHQNPAPGFNEPLDNACTQPGVDRQTLLSGVDSVLGATTLGTKARIERIGPRVGLIIIHGFESTVQFFRCRGSGEDVPQEEIKDMSRAKRPKRGCLSPRSAGSNSGWFIAARYCWTWTRTRRGWQFVN